MHFTETALRGAWIVDLDPREDERGFFARAFCEREFSERGISPHIRQANLSSSRVAGTLRGLHFQYPPASENKYVRCIRGGLVDVIVDLRPESSTFLQHVAVELTEDNRRALVVPPRFAHGFVTLRDDTEVLYMVDEFYTPSEEGGLRWDDPGLGIEWPRRPATVSVKDEAWPLLDLQRADLRARMSTPSTSGEPSA
jgi:dTDP-4-dehydrorhamnose 3,5-epimerase